MIFLIINLENKINPITLGSFDLSASIILVILPEKEKTEDHFPSLHVDSLHGPSVQIPCGAHNNPGRRGLPMFKISTC